MKLKKTQIIGFIFTVIVGTVLHFTYEWSGENAFVGTFSPVNESVWEHLKLLYVPMIIFGIIEVFLYGRKKANFIPIRSLSILLGMLFIVAAFYIYSGIIGRNYFVVDILIYIAAVYASYFFSKRLLKTEKFTSPASKILAILGIILLIALTIEFTFAPPHIELFRDPNTGTFGALLSTNG